MNLSKLPWRQVDTTIEDADGNLIIECKHGTEKERLLNARYAVAAANSVQPLRDRLKERDSDVETFSDLVLYLRESRREARLQRDLLLSALNRLMESAGDICTATDDQLREAAEDGDNNVREAAAAFLQAREAVRAVMP